MASAHEKARAVPRGFLETYVLPSLGVVLRPRLSRGALENIRDSRTDKQNRKRLGCKAGCAVLS